MPNFQLYDLKILFCSCKKVLSELKNHKKERTMLNSTIPKKTDRKKQEKIARQKWMGGNNHA